MKQNPYVPVAPNFGDDRGRFSDPTGYVNQQPGVYESSAYGDPGRQRRWNNTRSFLGDAQYLLPERPMTHAQLGVRELGLNEGVRRQNERDFRSGIQQGVQGRALVGSTPEATLAREIAMAQVNAPGPGGAIRSAGAQSAGDLRLLSQEGMARRGLGGGTAYSDMQRGQQALAADIAQRAADADALHMQRSLENLAQISQFEQLQRDAYTTALMDALFNVQRGDYDISGLSPNLFR